MLKAEVTEKYTKIEINATLAQLCSDLTHILRGVNKRLSENPEAGHQFRVVFTKGFMDGICFDDDREHMEHYLAEGDESEKRHREKMSGIADLLQDVIDALKQTRDGMQSAKEELDKLAKEQDEDETE